MPSAVPGNLSPCPLCAAEPRRSGKSGLRKCLLSLQPSIHVTVCIHPECTYYAASETLSSIQLDPEVTQSKIHYNFEGLDSALFIICNSMFLSYCHENNMIPESDLLYKVMQVATKESKNARLLICDVKKVIMSQISNDLEDTWHCIKNSLEKLCSLSKFLKKSLAVRWKKEMKCINKCSVDPKSAEESKSIVSSTDAGVLDFLPTPVIVSNNVECDICSTRKQACLVNVQRASNFVMISTPNGIQLPMEGNMTCFQEKGTQSVYRLHSITVKENNNSLVTFLCDAHGHLRTQFQCQTLTSFPCTLKLSSVRPKSLVFVVFEKLYEDNTLNPFKPHNPWNQSYIIPAANSVITQTTNNSSQVYLPKSLKRPNNAMSKTPQIVNSSWSLEETFPSATTTVWNANKPSRVFAKRKFQSYAQSGGPCNEARICSAEIFEQNNVKDAMNWKNNIQRRFLSIADGGRRAKVSNYIATLQNLNVKILESESEVTSNNRSRSGLSTPLSISKVISQSAHATPRITPVHSPSAATVHVSSNDFKSLFH